MTFLCPLLERRSLAVSDKSDAMKSLWVKLLLDGIRPRKSEDDDQRFKDLERRHVNKPAQTNLRVAAAN